jgi:hypothetical protein
MIAKYRATDKARPPQPDRVPASPFAVWASRRGVAAARVRFTAARCAW